MAFLLATLAAAVTVLSLQYLAASPRSQRQRWLTLDPHNAVPIHYAHDTSGTYSVHSSMAPLPLPLSSSTAPPTPARTAHPSYPDASAQDYPSSSYKSISTTACNQKAAHKKSPIPNKQIQNQLPQNPHLLTHPLPKNIPRIIRRRHTIRRIRPPRHLIHNRILQPLHLQPIRHLPQPNQPEICRMRPIERFVRKCARVEPLDEVLEVLRVVGGEGEGGGEGFAETVVGVECCCEEGGDG